MPNEQDLYLSYQFTDRGGKLVYDVYEKQDGFKLMEGGKITGRYLGEIRLNGRGWPRGTETNLGRVVEHAAAALYCDDCDSEFTMSGKTFVGNWEDQNNPDCSHATHITQLCEACYAKRDES